MKTKVEITQDIMVRSTYTVELENDGNEEYLEAIRTGDGVGTYPIPVDLFLGERNPSAQLLKTEILSIHDVWDGDVEPMQPTIKIVEGGS
jgi:hypothetical protein